MKKSHGDIHVGTSGWSYDHWKGPFYPDTLPGNRMLAFYARYFHSVEINSSFYRLPEKKSLQHWYECTPDDFLFAAKASRYITHMKKLGDPHKSVPVFLKRIDLLGDKLGPILFQLPPHWRFNAERLSNFLDSLGRDFRFAFEFRDRSWLNPRTVDLLARHNVSCCIYELEGYVTPYEITADYIYVRLHGPGDAYQGRYSNKALSDWAGMMKQWAQTGKTVYCYFNNDQLGYAVKNAGRLREILSRQ